jgi:hypothetical protein
MGVTPWVVCVYGSALLYATELCWHNKVIWRYQLKQAALLPDCLEPARFKGELQFARMNELWTP